MERYISCIVKLSVMITKKLLSTITSIVFSLISTDAFAQEYCFNEVDYTPKETTFRLFAPSTAKKVCLKIYRDDYTCLLYTSDAADEL